LLSVSSPKPPAIVKGTNSQIGCELEENAAFAPDEGPIASILLACPSTWNAAGSCPPPLIDARQLQILGDVAGGKRRGRANNWIVNNFTCQR
jgi:hypothetical protein